MSESARWDDITFKQLKRFWPIILFVGGSAYAIGTGYANVLSRSEDHEKRITNMEHLVQDVLPDLKDGMDELLNRKRHRKHGG